MSLKYPRHVEHFNRQPTFDASVIDIAAIALTAAPVTVPTTGTSFKIFPTALRLTQLKLIPSTSFCKTRHSKIGRIIYASGPIIVNWTGTNKKASENGIGEQPIIAAVNSAWIILWACCRFDRQHPTKRIGKDAIKLRRLLAIVFSANALDWLKDLAIIAADCRGNFLQNFRKEWMELWIIILIHLPLIK